MKKVVDASQDVRAAITDIYATLRRLEAKIDSLQSKGTSEATINDLRYEIQKVARRPITLDFRDVFRASGPAHMLGYVPDPGVTPGDTRYLREDAQWVEAGVGGLFQRSAAYVNPSGALAVVAWRSPYDCTVLNVRGFRVGGTGATVNARKNGASNHLASDLSLSSAGTWMDGGAVQNATYAAGDYLEFLLQSVAGPPTQAVIQVDFRRTN